MTRLNVEELDNIMNIYRLNTHRTRTFLVNQVSKPEKCMFLCFMLLFQGSGSLVTQLKKSYSLTDLTAADDEDDCDGGIQSTPRHAHYSNFFAYCLLFMILNDTWKCVEKKNLDHTFWHFKEYTHTLRWFYVPFGFKPPV